MTTPAPTECRQCCDPSCAGDGLIYDTANREYDVRISNDPGNQIVFGSDGGLLAPPVPGTETIVTEGNGIDVTGGGSAVNPYVVAVQIDPAAGNVITNGPAGLYAPAAAVDDGNGINVTGAGTTADPFLVSVELSPAPGNVAQVGPNGVYVPATVVQSGDGVDVSGAGTTGSPYVLDANEAEMISPAAGNTLTINGGKLYVPAGAATVVQSGTGATVTGAGTPGSPYVVNALSGDAGQILVEGADGGVLLDCDTVTGGSVWPHACAVATNGQRAYCAPDGSLRLPPEKFYDAASVDWQVVPGAGQPISDLSPADATYRQIGPTTPLVFTNPSPCLPMRITVECILAHVALTTGSGPVVDVVLEARVALTGDITDAFNAHQIWRADSPGDITSSFTFDSSTASTRRVYTLPPGGTVTINGSQWLNVRNNTTDAGSPNPNRLSNWVGQIHVFGGTV